MTTSRIARMVTSRIGFTGEAPNEPQVLQKMMAEQLLRNSRLRLVGI
jgi:hypothetical protein